MNALVELIKAASRPLLPQPTGAQEVLPQLRGIRVVLFDVYGTLFVSGTGDISLALKEDRHAALLAALAEGGFTVLNAHAPLSQLLNSCIENFRTDLKSRGTAYPEVRIETIWKTFIQSAAEQHWIDPTGNLKRALVAYECRVNPCWPMPEANDALAQLRTNTIRLGIISNAQFYTPLLFEALMDNTVQGLGFDPDLCIWSYERLEAKPSTRLYSIAAETLAQRGIRPAEVLFVGNDMRNDIWPAQAVGFKTALFAGDARSLRWRKDDPEVQHVRPDSILTSFGSLLKVLGLP